MTKKKKKNDSVPVFSGTTPKKKPNVKLVIATALSAAAVFGFYRYMLNTRYFVSVLVLYMALLAVLSVSYVVYNRGFSLNGITADMLPDSMTAEEKKSFVSEVSERRKKSRWLLVLIFSFIFTFAIDALSWFITDNLLPSFKF